MVESLMQLDTFAAFAVALTENRCGALNVKCISVSTVS